MPEETSVFWATDDDSGESELKRIISFSINEIDIDSNSKSSLRENGIRNIGCMVSNDRLTVANIVGDITAMSKIDTILQAQGIPFGMVFAPELLPDEEQP